MNRQEARSDSQAGLYVCRIQGVHEVGALRRGSSSARAACGQLQEVKETQSGCKAEFQGLGFGSP